MLSAVQAEMLEQLERAHNRILIIVTVGFLTGFFTGLLAAWLMK